ncbi:hypothetical protein [Chondromyces crocatus]|uniref:DUF2846 domain-containing protein n=1 Tax=Chondromyces crocatus TaxID=52 RepID=A0A0K1EHI6_CHOCO|nr:hypothetical protein [Chondromyces crocatus]AKT40336.1 uncharacterized protein CMC5_044890 [Chondromyces crocatus]
MPSTVSTLFARFVAPAALAVVGLTTGCSSWRLSEPAQAPIAPMAAPPEGMAKICVVRADEAAHEVTFPVHDNGVLVGATRGPGHFCYLAEPGHHVVESAADEVATATIDAAPGGRYTLLQEVEDRLGHVTCRASWVGEKEAREHVTATPYAQLVGVPSEEKLPEAVPRAAAIRR